jgi:hypothetical protein
MGRFETAVARGLTFLGVMTLFVITWLVLFSNRNYAVCLQCNFALIVLKYADGSDELLLDFGL